MDLILLALTIGPGLLILTWVYLKDRYEKEPWALVGLCLLLGFISPLAVISISPFWETLGFHLSDSLLDTAKFAYLSVALTEEGVKAAIMLLVAYPRKAFNEPFDGIVYAVAVSMGFAISENLLYVFGKSVNADADWVAILRAITAVPAHASFAILMGYFMGISKFHRIPGVYLVIGLAAAVLFHGSYDFFLFIQNIPGISIGAFASLYIGIRLSQRAILMHQEGSPFKSPW
ncbi:MAG: PrsW family glutamic-type intramembrane protease [Bacteroidota bacterium]|nr:PrsW family glutamic-type intramembrane protease [Bacteroidota bacterium]MDX5430061.1 PrsW family glutamic-type intramembrane protease [Bacteroidota bacterium]MDX5468831.1 PrsW family glutamic-type intramembrane protease [Bacteroidota bacterium]